MPMNDMQALEQARAVKEKREGERAVLDVVRQYWTGRQSIPAVLPQAVPNEVREMARMSRVNICDIVVESMSQSLFADGFRLPKDGANVGVWKVWEANKLAARQSGIHRAALAYGTAYAIVLPGRPAPVIRGCSPRALTAVYGLDPDWPRFALERRAGAWRLYDATTIYVLDDAMESVIQTLEHPLGVCPVVRYLDTVDLDADDEVADSRPWARSKAGESMVAGQVGKLQALQDQIDFTTFNLLVAQHYSAFRQRYVIGWTAEDESEKFKAAASKLWTFEDPPDTVQVGEFSQTDLDGYIKSREASLRHAATLSQTPVHELIGELVNLSAEALAAAEAGRDRKVEDRKTILGESHEQTLWAAGRLIGEQVPDEASMVWRDTSARAFGAVIDGLGKMAQMLQIPVEELWERIPGVTQADVDRWKAARAAQPAPESDPTESSDTEADDVPEPQAA